MSRRSGVLAAIVAAGGWGCAAAPYSACPIDFPGGLPPHAFAACRDVLVARFGALVTVDAAAFRLQSDWVGCTDLPGERRASVFRQGDGAAAGLGVVVELRRLSEPLVGLPRWTAPRGDAAAERELAELLRRAIDP
jgi:hypothetical protein